MNAPGYAYVVVDARGEPCFSHVSFERAAERATALMRGDCDSQPAQTNYYRIVRVEAE